MKSERVHRERLKTWNIVLQLAGGILLCCVLWFSLFSLLGGLSIIGLLVIVISIFKVAKSVVSIEMCELGKLTLVKLSKKKEVISDVYFKELIGDIHLFNSKGKKLIVLNKFDWTNFEELTKSLRGKAKPYVEPKDSFKKFLKEVVNEELKDPL